MHAHMELIMPRVANIDKVIEQVMKPFGEGNEEGYKPTFWDWYVVGGRWAGAKEKCTYSEDKLSQFYEELTKRKVTVSSLQAGKQELKPASQIPMVDKLWNEFFPTEDGTIVACPLFKHSNNQYDDNDLLGCDISRVDEIPPNLMASTVAIAVPNSRGEIEIENLYHDEIWNGATHQKAAWDGNVLAAIELHNERVSYYSEEARDRVTPKPDWLCITIDYHC